MQTELSLRQFETFWVELTSNSNFEFLSEKKPYSFIQIS